MLFPQVPATEGWALIDAAIDRAADPKRIERIENLATNDLSGDL